MKYPAVFLILSITCSLSAAFVTPKDVTNALTPLQLEELNLFRNSINVLHHKTLIGNLVQSLRKSANEASDAIATFSNGVQEEVRGVKHKITKDIQKLREQVSQVVEDVTNKLLDTGVAVTECIVIHRDDAYVVFNETYARTTRCVDDRIAEITDQISNFENLVKGALKFTNSAIENMRNCSEGDDGFLTIGSCLGSVAFQTDMRAVVFATQSGLLIARMNLLMATFPASLQLCAGTRLVEAGLHSAKIIMDIGTCTATSFYSIMTNNTQIFKNYS